MRIEPLSVHAVADSVLLLARSNREYSFHRFSEALPLTDGQR